MSILAERSARPPPTDQLASARIAVATMASSSDRLPCVILVGWRADCLLDDAGPTPTPIGRVRLDVIRYIASAFLSEASAATLSRSENRGWAGMPDATSRDWLKDDEGEPWSRP